MTRIYEESKPADRSRTLALSALADIGDPASRQVFLDSKADKDVTIRLYANEGLARLADQSLGTVMSADRLVEKNARVQSAQAFGLLRIGRAEYLEELVRALGKPATKDLAREYLLETQVTERPALFAMQPKSAAARAELADVLGLMGDRAALPALQEMEHDADSTVARNAERAIRRITAATRGSTNVRRVEGGPFRVASSGCRTWKRLPTRVYATRLTTTDYRTRRPEVFLVADLLQPFCLAAETHGHVNERTRRRRSVPVDDVGAGVVAVSSDQILERRSPFLNPCLALLDEQELPAWMAVPGGPRAGLKAPARHGRAGVFERFRLPRETGCVGNCGGGLLSASPDGRTHEQDEERARERDSLHM